MNPYSAKRIERLYQLTPNQLMKEYARITGESYYTRNRKSLIRKIAWLYLSENSKPLSQMALDRIEELKNTKARINPHPRFKIDIPNIERPKKSEIEPGTILRKTYNGKKYEVTVLERGFLWKNNIYKSISAVAKAITGTHWNGKLFFGLK